MGVGALTMTRSAISATTPRSWVIRTIAAPTLRLRSSIKCRICAWIVTSSAVVGYGVELLGGVNHATAAQDQIERHCKLRR
jgi:hypothetical protein